MATVDEERASGANATAEDELRSIVEGGSVHDASFSVDLSSLEEEKKRMRRKKKKKKKHDKSLRFGDANMVFDDLGSVQDIEKATWGEIWQTCCVKSGEEWGWIILWVLLLVGSVYFFLFGIALLGNAAQVMAGCMAAEIFGETTNPLTGVMIAILATVLLQSSGTTTSVVVSLVEAGSISIQMGIYMIMGANIGTSVTSTIVSLGHMRNKEELERAFQAATVHDMFNCFTIAILFPLEAASGFLNVLTNELATGAETGGHEKWDGPIKKIVKPLANLVIISNKKVIIGVADGRSCESFYPIKCDEGVSPSYDTCKTGLIACDKATNKCPAFFNENATIDQDKGAGGAAFFIALIVLFASVTGVIIAVQKLLQGMSTKVVHTVTTCNGYIGIVFGTGLTLLAQSSSVTTSIIVPFAGVGALRLDAVYPFIVGANLGTATQAMISALGSIGKAPLQVALAHLFINLIGAIIWYPLPPLRKVPIWAARRLGRGAMIWRLFPIAYLFTLFFIIPMFFIGISALFTIGSAGAIAGGTILCVVLFFAFAYLYYYCKFKGGDQEYVNFCEQLTLRRQLRRGDEEGDAKDVEAVGTVGGSADGAYGELSRASSVDNGKESKSASLVRSSAVSA